MLRVSLQASDYFTGNKGKIECNISWKFRSSNCQNNCRSVNTVLLYFKSHTHLTEFDGIQCRSFKFLKENVKPNVHFN